MKGEMKICDRHVFKVPLIWTFAFNGSEYWCPYCGYNEGMLGAGRNVKSTKKMIERLERYKELSKEYLHVKGMLISVSASDLSIKEKEKFDKIISEWKYYIKL